MSIRPLHPAETDLYRRLRLDALRTDPSAFGSNLERELGFDEATWRARMAGPEGRPGQIFVDEVDGMAVGLVGIGRSADPSDAVLWGMWVSPAARGTGASTRLVQAAVDWAARMGASTVTLGVMRRNGPAIALYERMGFVAAGSVDGPPDDPCAGQLVMRRPAATTDGTGAAG